MEGEGGAYRREKEGLIGGRRRGLLEGEERLIGGRRRSLFNCPRLLCLFILCEDTVARLSTLGLY